ncbi:MAG TPA: uroporphyrinogen-III synthase, partial [Geobacterales bacterium]|nr:uroporphyrinogen-III synthase [Geobacterales bacterium]
SGFKAPAITVVGEVVRLRQQLRWFDNRPLSGRRVLVTRAADQAGEFARMLEERGAVVHECSTISIQPPEDPAELESAIAILDRCHWLILTSVNAVRFFFDRLNAMGLDARALGSCRVCAVGPKTAAAIADRGILPDLVPDDFRAEGVVAALAAIGVAGNRIIFPRGDRARELIPQQLTVLGAEVLSPVAYRNVIPDALPAQPLAALTERRIDCVTFTSSSTVENLARLVGENRLIGLLEGVAVAAIGPVTAATCRELGLSVAIEPSQYTLAALTDEMVRYFTPQ